MEAYKPKPMGKSQSLLSLEVPTNNAVHHGHLSIGKALTRSTRYVSCYCSFSSNFILSKELDLNEHLAIQIYVYAIKYML